jgi:hypothetical protein
MAGAGHVIMFVVSMVGCGIWTTIYLTFASHYLITTITESSAGNDEVQYPGEGILEWWWKPFFCIWILSIWAIPVAILATPLLAADSIAFVIGAAVLITLIYPLSLLSALYAQNWMMFMHPQVIWRMLRHFGAFGYVYLITSILLAACVGLLIAAFGHSFVWAVPAAFVIPTVFLLYARHWGRFSYLALNFDPGSTEEEPRKKRTRKREPEESVDTLPPAPVEPNAEPLPLEGETEENPEAVSAGLPPAHPTAIQPGVPATPDGIVVGPAPVVATAPVEEEDEWATNKKPYAVIEDRPTVAAQQSVPAYDREPESEANKPLNLSQYYDERHKKEKEAKAKREAASRTMAPTRGGAPSFQETLLGGVWEFMIYARTLRVWVNLVVLTAVELLLIFLVVHFWPDV